MIVIPETQSQEKKDTLRLGGATLHEVPAVPYKNPNNYVHVAQRLAERLARTEPHGAVWAQQFDNVANRQGHYETTGPEIFAQTGGTVDCFVAGMGTGGTLMGVAKFLRERKPNAAVVGVEPRLGHRIQGLKNMREAILPPIFREEELDEKLTVDDEPAFETARRLAVEEGLFVGMSSGAAVAGAIETARRMPAGIVVTLLPDRGDRYLSTALFRSVCAGCPP